MNKDQFIAAEFALSTYQARRDAKIAELEAKKAESIQKMIDAGFTEEEINNVLY